MTQCMLGRAPVMCLFSPAVRQSSRRPDVCHGSALSVSALIRIYGFFGGGAGGLITWYCISPVNGGGRLENSVSGSSALICSLCFFLFFLSKIWISLLIDEVQERGC